jgi:hypothetical protein
MIKRGHSNIYKTDDFIFENNRHNPFETTFLGRRMYIPTFNQYISCGQKIIDRWKRNLVDFAG